MQKIFYPLLLSLFIISCSKKTVPTETTPVAGTTTTTTPGSTAANTNTTAPAPNTKAVSAKEYSTGKRKVSGSTPRVIVVDDSKAKTTLDGKKYYDLGGYRYWRNSADGKYYLDGIFTEAARKKKRG